MVFSLFVVVGVCVDGVVVCSLFVVVAVGSFHLVVWPFVLVEACVSPSTRLLH